MRFIQDTDEKVNIQMGPMIDCVFLLLLYFISSSQIKQEEKYLGLMLPGPGTPKESIPAELTISIQENNQVLVNQSPVDSTDGSELPMLQAKLDQVIRLFGEKQPVVVHPQPRVRQQRIVDVLNTCTLSGVKNLSFFANQ